jgi:hypothetical protein
VVPATTTGVGDIHPVSGSARLIVTGQMITSLYLVVIALGTAAQRVLASRAVKCGPVNDRCPTSVAKQQQQQQ